VSTETQPGPYSKLVAEWQAGLDEHGHVKDSPACLVCERPLNADGNHPAETYGGTYNGLCHGCTGKPAILMAIAVLDGCWITSHPPRCPSWRRDRERHYGYPDCPRCKGWGRTYTDRCPGCSDRYFSHPLRVADMEYAMKLEHAIQRAARTQLLRALGVPKRASRKVQDAALEGLTEEIRDQVRQEMLPRVLALRTQRARRIARQQLTAVFMPAQFTGAFRKTA